MNVTDAMEAGLGNGGQGDRLDTGQVGYGKDQTDYDKVQDKDKDDAGDAQGRKLLGGGSSGIRPDSQVHVTVGCWGGSYWPPVVLQVSPECPG